MRTGAPAAAGAVAVLAAATLLGGCSLLGGDEEAEDPAALLAAARGTLDTAESLHVVIASSGLPEGVTALVGGEGDALRPDGFSGELQVTLAGVPAEVDVVSLDGLVYAELPFTTGFTQVDPQAVGISDPGLLLDPDDGVSGLLSDAVGPTLAGEQRIGEAVVRDVEATLPAAAVDRVLVSADPEGTFAAVFAVDPDTSQLRRATLTGPFLDAATDSTYVIDLDAYGEPVEITVPDLATPGASPS